MFNEKQLEFDGNSKELYKSFKLKRIFVIVLGSLLSVLLISYIGLSIFFMNHFQFNTKINDEDVSFKTISEVEPYLEKLIDSYNLTIVGKDNLVEEISGESISATIIENTETENILKEQNAFLWPKSLFQNNVKKIDLQITYDEGKLQQEINKLDIVSAEATPGENARPEFDGENYVIIPEVYGTMINQEKFIKKVREYIGGLETTLNAEQENCYIAPQYTADSEAVQSACEIMNRYVKSSITYTMPEPVIIDKTLISTWLFADENMEVQINNELIKKWLTELGDKYDTVGITRTFTTPTGKNASVAGGTYGWSINEDTELNLIIDNIKAGEPITRELTYYAGGVAAEHGMPDWGRTYIEVDLSEQHMWYILDGAVALETDVVTGQPIPEKITPEGVYSILDKRLGYVLTGATNPATGKPEYKTYVDYWMRVTWTGIGFHDATWQSAFGGTRNQISGVGSHGCINMPVDQAKALYSMIENETPVIIHY